jgi:hypothetical protein
MQAGKAFCQHYSLAAVLSLFSFFSQYVNLASRPMTLLDRNLIDDSFYYNLYGVVSIVVNQALLMGVILFALRRWTLPIGAVTMIWSINVLLMFFLRFRYNLAVWSALLAVPLAGLLADYLLWHFEQIRQNSSALRVFAFVVPFFSSLSYLLLHAMREGLWWKVHMWMGVPFIAGIACLLLSFLIFLPEIPIPSTKSVDGKTHA